MKATLKNPKSADFPLRSQSEYQGDSTFLVGSYVDAQNSFNVKLYYMGGEIMYYGNWFVGATERMRYLEMKTDDN